MDNGSIIQVGNIFPDTPTFKNLTAGRIFSIEGLSPTIRTPSGGGIIPQIVVPNNMTNNMQEYKAISYTRDSKGKTVNKHYNDIANTVHRSTGSGGNTDCLVATPDYRIRKYTPRECFRLMGVEEKDIETLLNTGLSNTRLYALAGNSIVVDVLYYIFKQMFIEADAKQLIENEQLTLF